MQIIGHRGWRGKYPENSLLGFEELVKSGVNAVELDVIITKDREILVSHEPWFDDGYCISKSRENLFRLDTGEIQQIDCGSKIHSRFPDQKKVKSIKPLFKDLIALWDKLHVKPYIALEVKSESHLYGSYQPFPEEFARLLVDFEKEYLQNYDYFVQSFDPFFLKIYHALKPETKTGLLIEYKTDLENDLRTLGYTPDFYNPDHVLLNDDLVTRIEKSSIGICTWTVNTMKEYNRIKDYPIAGLITDFPERFI